VSQRRGYRVRRALISVSDKNGIVELCQRPGGAGRRAAVHRRHLPPAAGGRPRRHGGLGHTGFPEMMDGRVKTLHPKIHGGILARRGEDDAVMAEHGSMPIDLVVVNLYPFEATVARTGLHARRRSRTSTSAARACCAPRPRTTPGSPVVTAPRTTRGAGRLAEQDGCVPTPPAVTWPCAPSNTPRPTTAPSPTISARGWRMRRAPEPSDAP
jgi:hypothetical protein